MRQPIYYQNPWIRWLIAHGYEGPPPSPLYGSLSAHAFNPQPDPPGNILDPSPAPWRFAVLQLVQAAQAKDLATRLSDERLKNAMMSSAGKAIDHIIDDWCGTHPGHPWPWPGPPPWVWEIVSELSLVANTLQPGGLRDEIQQVATQALQKGGAAT